MIHICQHNRRKCWLLIRLITWQDAIAKCTPTAILFQNWTSLPFSNSFAQTVNTLGTGVANLQFYGSTMADQTCKFAILRYIRFENTIHLTSTI
jgi:hypothetical protein